MAEKQYINKDNPVYISYSWADDKCSDIEESVKKICAVLDKNGVYYKRNSDSDIPYCASLDEIQRETGRGALVIVIISKGYIGSLDCMHEWHCIRENGKIWERVLPVVMDDAKLRDKEVFMDYYNSFEDRQNSLIDQQKEGIIPLTKSETNAAEFGYYVEDLKNMYKYLADTNYRFDDYSVLADRIREKLGLNSPESSQNNAQQGGNAGAFIHNENKGGVQNSGGTMKGNITINNTFNTNIDEMEEKMLKKMMKKWSLIPILISIVFVVSVVVDKTNSGSQNNESKVDSTIVSENPDTFNNDIAIIADTLTPQFNYLTFTAQEPNSSIGIKNWYNNPDIEYSIDEGETWQKLGV